MVLGPLLAPLKSTNPSKDARPHRELGPLSFPTLDYLEGPTFPFSDIPVSSSLVIKDYGASVSYVNPFADISAMDVPNNQ